MSQITCKSLIKQEFEERQKQSGKYSLRCFAKDLNVSPAFLSRILNGKRQLPVKRAVEFGRRLNWTAKKSTVFETLALFESMKMNSEIDLMRARLERLTTKSTVYKQLNNDVFQLASHWCHYAILELADISPSLVKVSEVAKRFRISTMEAEVAIGRLLRLGLLQKTDQGYGPSTSHRSIPAAPSAARREFHKQMITKALNAVEKQAYDQRDLSAVVMAIDPAKLPEAEQRIADFRKELTEFLNTGSENKSVYALTVQLFSLEK